MRMVYVHRHANRSTYEMVAKIDDSTGKMKWLESFS